MSFLHGKRNLRAPLGEAELSPDFDQRGLKEVVRDRGGHHRERDEKQWAKDQILDPKHHEDEIKDRDMKQIHAIRVEGDLLDHDVERPICRVSEGIDG
jgi:hypothetical protein